jgi:hypothetical protein
MLELYIAVALLFFGFLCHDLVDNLTISNIIVNVLLAVFWFVPFTYYIVFNIRNLR